MTDPAYNDPQSESYNPNLAPYDGTRGGSPFVFSSSKTGAYVAGFLQDTIRWNDLTASIGLRFDHNYLFISENQWQPRIGLAYFLKPTNTVFRASYNRMFITPKYENILLSSSPQAASIAPPDIQDSQGARRGPALQRLRAPRRLERRSPAGDRLEASRWTSRTGTGA